MSEFAIVSDNLSITLREFTVKKNKLQEKSVHNVAVCIKNFFFSFVGVVLIMKSDIDYSETTKRVLFSSNKKDEINRTEDITTTDKCSTWKAYLRVSQV